MNFSFNLSLPHDLVLIFGILGSLLAFFKGVIEYTRQGSEKRADRFFKLEREFFQSECNKNICRLLESDDPRLLKIEYEDKLNFLGFLEQVALLVNSKLLRFEVANYVYGYYISKCAGSVNFWTSELDKTSPYWTLFFSFSDRIKISNIQNVDVTKLRF
jgi:hypothetical protein